MQLLAPDLIKEKSGEYKFERVSLRLKDSWFFEKSQSALTENKLVLGGGFKIIENGQFKFDLKCYSDENANQEIPCTTDRIPKKTRLNGEPVKVDDSKDYEKGVKGEWQTGFKARSGKSIVGIHEDGGLVLASCPGFTLAKASINQNMGCTVEDLSNFLIVNYNVKQAFMTDGGTESSILWKGEIKNGKKFVPPGFSLFAQDEVPSSLFIFVK